MRFVTKWAAIAIAIVLLAFFGVAELINIAIDHGNFWIYAVFFGLIKILSTRL